MHASQVDLGSWQAVIGHTRQSCHGLNGWVIKYPETTLTLTKMKLYLTASRVYIYVYMYIDNLDPLARKVTRVCTGH